MNLDDRYCSVVNTHSSYHDVLAVFIESYKRHASGVDLFVFSNESIPSCNKDIIHLIKYSAANFRDQYFECLQKVPYEYILTFNDDYFLQGSPRYLQISNCVDVLENSEYSQIRFVRGPNFFTPARLSNLYPMDNRQPYFFSQTLSLWKRRDLLRVFDAVAPSGIGRKGKELQFETLANVACQHLGLSGLVYFENEKKVGSNHYQCNLVPHIVSAIVDGYWNTEEYSYELSSIERELRLSLNHARYRKNLKNLLRKVLG